MGLDIKATLFCYFDYSFFIHNVYKKCKYRQTIPDFYEFEGCEDYEQEEIKVRDIP